MNVCCIFLLCSDRGHILQFYFLKRLFDYHSSAIFRAFVMAEDEQKWIGFSVSTPQTADKNIFINKFVKGKITQSVGDLVSAESPSFEEGLIIEKIEASKTFRKCDGINNHVSDVIHCDPTMPLGVLYDNFGMRYIYATFKQRIPDDRDNSRKLDGPSAFDILMTINKKYDHLPNNRYSILVVAHLYYT